MMVKLILITGLVMVLASPASGAGDGRPSSGTTVMRIGIPSIHLNMKVVEGGADGSEDGYYPTHYRTTDWAGEGEAVAVSAHHLTHALRGTAGGPFLRIDELHDGDAVYLTRLAKFGGGTFRYRVTGQRQVYCGPEKADALYCTKAVRYFTNLRQDKLILTTCIGDGHWRRIVYAFPSRK
jgi:LPXTG-site transpeptidase (sortase) family protein